MKRGIPNWFDLDINKAIDSPLGQDAASPSLSVRGFGPEGSWIRSLIERPVPGSEWFVLALPEPDAGPVLQGRVASLAAVRPAGKLTDMLQKPVFA